MVLWSPALAQAGPWGIPASQGAQAGELYQNPVLGMEFPLPEGFWLVAEAPYEGGLVMVFIGQGGAELYAVSHRLSQPLDLQTP